MFGYCQWQVTAALENEYKRADTQYSVYRVMLWYMHKKFVPSVKSELNLATKGSAVLNP